MANSACMTKTQQDESSSEHDKASRPRARPRVLAIGASGSFGGAVTRELAARGCDVSAMVRPGGRAVNIDGVSTVAGDALSLDDLRRATEGAEIIVYGFNLPYPEWHANAVRAAKLLAQVAAERGALVVFPGNVYGLGPDFSEPLHEASDRDCPSRKGALRNEMEEVLVHATTQGARLLVVRAGDYFGPDAGETSWLHFMTARARGTAWRLRPAWP